MTIQTARPAELRISEPTPRPLCPISAAELAADRHRRDHGPRMSWRTVWPRVRQYAPDAPTAVQREAAIRFAGWLLEAPAGGVRSESTGDISDLLQPVDVVGFRASGAAALLVALAGAPGGRNRG